MKELVTAFAACAIAGAVLAADSNIVGYNTMNTAANKMDILGVHFQNIGYTTINVQDVEFASGMTEGEDLLRVWNPATAKYVAATYYGDTYDPSDTGYTTDLGPGWADVDQFRVDIPISVGQGFWLTTPANAVIAFPVPAGIL